MKIQILYLALLMPILPTIVSGFGGGNGFVVPQAAECGPPATGDQTCPTSSQGKCCSGFNGYECLSDCGGIRVEKSEYNYGVTPTSAPTRPPTRSPTKHPTVAPTVKGRCGGSYGACGAEKPCCHDLRDQGRRFTDTMGLGGMNFHGFCLEGFDVDDLHFSVFLSDPACGTPAPTPSPTDAPTVRTDCETHSCEAALPCCAQTTESSWDGTWLTSVSTYQCVPSGFDAGVDVTAIVENANVAGSLEVVSATSHVVCVPPTAAPTPPPTKAPTSPTAAPTVDYDCRNKFCAFSERPCCHYDKGEDKYTCMSEENIIIVEGTDEWGVLVEKVVFVRNHPSCPYKPTPAPTAAPTVPVTPAPTPPMACFSNNCEQGRPCCLGIYDPDTYDASSTMNAMSALTCEAADVVLSVVATQYGSFVEHISSKSHSACQLTAAPTVAPTTAAPTTAAPTSAPTPQLSCDMMQKCEQAWPCCVQTGEEEYQCRPNDSPVFEGGDYTLYSENNNGACARFNPYTPPLSNACSYYDVDLSVSVVDADGQTLGVNMDTSTTMCCPGCRDSGVSHCACPLNSRLDITIETEQRDGVTGKIIVVTTWDRYRCVACPGGYVNNDGDGQQVSAPFAVLGSGGKCGACAPGTFENVTSAVLAMHGAPAGTCAAGLDVAGPRRACETCPPGRTSDAGATACRACQAGQYSNDTTAGLCVDCDPGTYSDEGGGAQCSACSAGFYAAGGGSTSCDTCRPGKYGNSTGADECTDCPEGRYGENSKATICEECEVGTFNAIQGQTACQECQAHTEAGATDCSSCPAGQYQDATTGVCEACPQHHYSNGGNVTECAACPANTETVAEGGSFCTSCASGRQGGSAGAGCMSCPSGRYHESHTYSTAQVMGMHFAEVLGYRLDVGYLDPFGNHASFDGKYRMFYQHETGEVIFQLKKYACDDSDSSPYGRRSASATPIADPFNFTTDNMWTLFEDMIMSLDGQNYEYGRIVTVNNESALVSEESPLVIFEIDEHGVKREVHADLYLPYSEGIGAFGCQCADTYTASMLGQSTNLGCQLTKFSFAGSKFHTTSQYEIHLYSSGTFYVDYRLPHRVAIEPVAAVFKKDNIRNCPETPERNAPVPAQIDFAPQYDTPENYVRFEGVMCGPQKNEILWNKVSRCGRSWDRQHERLPVPNGGTCRDIDLGHHQRSRCSYCRTFTEGDSAHDECFENNVNGSHPEYGCTTRRDLEERFVRSQTVCLNGEPVTPVNTHGKIFSFDDGLLAGVPAGTDISPGFLNTLMSSHIPGRAIRWMEQTMDHSVGLPLPDEVNWGPKSGACGMYAMTDAERLLMQRLQDSVALGMSMEQTMDYTGCDETCMEGRQILISMGGGEWDTTSNMIPINSTSDLMEEVGAEWQRLTGGPANFPEYATWSPPPCDDVPLDHSMDSARVPGFNPGTLGDVGSQSAWALDHLGDCGVAPRIAPWMPTTRAELQGGESEATHGRASTCTGECPSGTHGVDTAAVLPVNQSAGCTACEVGRYSNKHAVSDSTGCTVCPSTVHPYYGTTVPGWTGLSFFNITTEKIGTYYLLFDTPAYVNTTGNRRLGDCQAWPWHPDLEHGGSRACDMRAMLPLSSVYDTPFQATFDASHNTHAVDMADINATYRDLSISLNMACAALNPAVVADVGSLLSPSESSAVTSNVADNTATNLVVAASGYESTELAAMYGTDSPYDGPLRGGRFDEEYHPLQTPRAHLASSASLDGLRFTAPSACLKGKIGIGVDCTGNGCRNQAVEDVSRLNPNDRNDSTIVTKMHPYDTWKLDNMGRTQEIPWDESFYGLSFSGCGKYKINLEGDGGELRDYQSGDTFVVRRMRDDQGAPPALEIQHNCRIVDNHTKLEMGADAQIAASERFRLRDAEVQWRGLYAYSQYLSKLHLMTNSAKTLIGDIEETLAAELDDVGSTPLETNLTHLLSTLDLAEDVSGNVLTFNSNASEVVTEALLSTGGFVRKPYVKTFTIGPEDIDVMAGRVGRVCYAVRPGSRVFVMLYRESTTEDCRRGITPEKRYSHTMHGEPQERSECEAGHILFARAFDGSTNSDAVYTDEINADFTLDAAGQTENGRSKLKGVHCAAIDTFGEFTFVGANVFSHGILPRSPRDSGAVNIQDAMRKCVEYDANVGDSYGPAILEESYFQHYMLGNPEAGRPVDVLLETVTDENPARERDVGWRLSDLDRPTNWRRRAKASINQCRLQPPVFCASGSLSVGFRVQFPPEADSWTYWQKSYWLDWMDRQGLGRAGIEEVFQAQMNAGDITEQQFNETMELFRSTVEQFNRFSGTHDAAGDGLPTPAPTTPSPTFKQGAGGPWVEITPGEEVLDVVGADGIVTAEEWNTIYRAGRLAGWIPASVEQVPTALELRELWYGRNQPRCDLHGSRFRCTNCGSMRDRCRTTPGCDIVDERDFNSDYASGEYWVRNEGTTVNASVPEGAQRFGAIFPDEHRAMGVDTPYGCTNKRCRRHGGWVIDESAQFSLMAFGYVTKPGELAMAQDTDREICMWEDEKVNNITYFVHNYNSWRNAEICNYGFSGFCPPNVTLKWIETVQISHTMYSSHYVYRSQERECLEIEGNKCACYSGFCDPSKPAMGWWADNGLNSTVDRYLWSGPSLTNELKRALGLYAHLDWQSTEDVLDTLADSAGSDEEESLDEYLENRAQTIADAHDACANRRRRRRRSDLRTFDWSQSVRSKISLQQVGERGIVSHVTFADHASVLGQSCSDYAVTLAPTAAPTPALPTSIVPCGEEGRRFGSTKCQLAQPCCMSSLYLEGDARCFSSSDASVHRTLYKGVHDPLSSDSSCSSVSDYVAPVASPTPVDDSPPVCDASREIGCFAYLKTTEAKIATGAYNEYYYDKYNLTNLTATIHSVSDSGYAKMLQHVVSLEYHGCPPPCDYNYAPPTTPTKCGMGSTDDVDDLGSNSPHCVVQGSAPDLSTFNDVVPASFGALCPRGTQLVSISNVSAPLACDEQGSNMDDLVCQACPAGQTTDPYPIGSTCVNGTSGRERHACHLELCEVDQYASDGECLPCPKGQRVFNGTRQLAMPRVASALSACEWHECALGQHVVDYQCVDCSASFADHGGIANRDERQSTKLGNTPCLCPATYRVRDGSCEECPRSSVGRHREAFSTLDRDLSVGNSSFECNCAAGEFVGLADSMIAEDGNSMASYTKCGVYWSLLTFNAITGENDVGIHSFSDCQCVHCPCEEINGRANVMYGRFQPAEGVCDWSRCQAPCADNQWLFREEVRSTYGNYITQERVCYNITTCEEGTHEAAAPTATSDRVCASNARCQVGERLNSTKNGCETCPSGTFNPYPNRSFEECMPVNLCDEGEYLADTSPATGGVCTACPHGTWMDFSHTQMVSVPVYWTGSNGVQYVTGSRQEEVYIEGHSQTECAEWRECPAWTYVSRNGTATQNVACSGWSGSCPNGQMKAHENRTRADDCESCNAGYGLSSESACAACQHPYASGEGSGACDLCEAGYGWTGSACEVCDFPQYNDETSGAPCLDMACPVGQGVWDHQDGGVAYLSNSCTECASPGYSDSAGMGVCVQVACAAGERFAHHGVSQASECVACAEGTFVGAAGHFEVACAEWSTCAAGERLVQNGTSASDAVCVACPEGSFSDGSGSSCQEWRVCGAGQKIAQSGTNASDVSCAACPEGSFSVGTAGTCASKTTECPAGEYLVVVDGSETDNSCVPCAAGTFRSGSSEATSNDHSITWSSGLGGSVSHGGTLVVGANDRVFLSWTGGHNVYRASGPCESFPSLQSFQSVATAIAAHHPGGIIVYRLPDTDTPASFCYICITHFSSMQFTLEVSPAASGGSSTSSASCADKTMSCPAGEELQTSGNATADNLCVGCPAWTFKSSTGGLSCASKRAQCGEGMYLNASGTELADNACLTCPHGEFKNDTSDAESCTAKQQSCEAGKYFVESMVSSADNACEPCPADTFKAGTNAHTLCLSKTSICPAGKRLHISNSPTSDNTCEPCLADTFKAEVNNATSCRAKIEACGTGEYLQLSHSASEDNSCVGCAYGSYKNGTTNATHCTPWTLCGSGYGRTPGTGSNASDAQCQHCDSNANSALYSNETSYAACVQHQKCLPGYGSNFEQLDNSTMEGTQCAQCDDSEYSLGDYSSCLAKRTECPPGLFLVVSNSSEADSSCAVCHEGTYKAATNGATACESKTPGCPAGEYFTASDDAASDNICTVCPAETYKIGNNTATSCTAKTDECGSGKMLKPRGGSAADNVCLPCQGDTFKVGVTNATNCDVKKTECPAGQYFVSSNTVVQDNVCLSCASGEFKTGFDNATACAPKLVTCAAGAALELSGNTTTNNWCTPCDAGLFRATAGAGECQAKLGQCAAGHHLVLSHSTSQDNSCVECPWGTYAPATNNLTTCEEWTKCDRGSGRVPNSGSVLSDAQCQSCDSNANGSSYSNESSYAACVQHQKCLPGYGSNFEQLGDATAEEATCALCGNGHYSDAESFEPCLVKRTECPPGVSLVLLNSSEVDNSCAACPEGKFKAATSAGACEPKNLQCPAGEYLQLSGSAVSDNVCAACTASEFKADTNNATSCTVKTTECGAGEYLQLRAGSAQDNVCKPCEEGSFSAEVGGVVCTGKRTMCPPGQFLQLSGSTVADNTCGTCDSSEFKAGVNNATSCEPLTEVCEAGKFLVLSGTLDSNNRCEGCPAGRFSGVISADTQCAAWSTCPVGSGRLDGTGNATTDMQCESCNSGRYSEASDQSRCQEHVVCPPGQGSTWSALTNSSVMQSSCVPCNSLEYSDASNLQPCVRKKADCTSGEYLYTSSSQTADNACRPCSSLTFKVGVNNETCAPKRAECDPGQVFVPSYSATADNSCAPCPDSTYHADTNHNATSCTSKRQECAAEDLFVKTSQSDEDNNCLALNCTLVKGVYTDEHCGCGTVTVTMRGSAASGGNFSCEFLKNHYRGHECCQGGNV